MSTKPTSGSDIVPGALQRPAEIEQLRKLHGRNDPRPVKVTVQAMNGGPPTKDESDCINLSVQGMPALLAYIDHLEGALKRIAARAPEVHSSAIHGDDYDCSTCKEMIEEAKDALVSFSSPSTVQPLLSEGEKESLLLVDEVAQDIAIHAESLACGGIKSLPTANLVSWAEELKRAVAVIEKRFDLAPKEG